MEKGILEFVFFDKLKWDNRGKLHIATFYRADRKGPDGMDNGTSIALTGPVAHFLLYAGDTFVKDRDKLCIHTIETNSGPLVDHCYINAKNGTERIDMHGYASDKPLVYLASEFKSDKAKKLVALMEDTIIHAGYVVFSPSRDGVVMKPDEQPDRKRMLEEHTDNIELCSLIVANLDDATNEVFFYMGCGHSLDKPIITFSAEGNDVSLSTQESVMAHIKSPEELLDVLQTYYAISSRLTIHTYKAAEVLADIQVKYKHYA